MSFSFHVPTNLVFGQGAIQKLHKQRLPGKHALIVISSGKSTRANGYLDIVQDQLTQAGVTYTVFDKILANPVLDNVMDGAACARANGCDFVLGLGGGSSIDAAKAIAEKLDSLGIRCELDLRNEKIGFKIREAQMDKIPYMFVLGDKEAENGTVAVRGRKGDLGTMGVDEIIAKLMEEIRTKAIN